VKLSKTAKKLLPDIIIVTFLVNRIETIARTTPNLTFGLVLNIAILSTLLVGLFLQWVWLPRREVN